LKSKSCIYLLGALFLLNSPAMFAQQSPVVSRESDIQTLKSNQPLQRQIKGGETHVFQFRIKAGQFARAEVVPTNIDVIVSLFDGNDKQVIEMDGDSSFLWFESVSAIAEKGGSFKLQIKGKGKSEATGSYSVKIAELRKSTATDRKRIEAEKTLVQAIKLSQEKKDKESIAPFETAVNLWREVGDKHWETVTMWNLAYAYYYSDRDSEALNLFNQVLVIFQEIKDRIGEAAAINGIGNFYRIAKKYELAREYLEKGLAIRKELKRLRSEYNSLNVLLSVYQNLNLTDKVAESQARMLAIADELNDKNSKAETLKIFGNFYRDIYKYEKAAEFYEKALPMYQELKDVKTEIFLQMFLGLLYGSNVEYEKAKVHLERYAEMIKESGEAGNWTAYQYLGMVYEALQQYEKVLPNYEKALEIAKKVNDKRDSEGNILFSLGSFYERKGENDKARVYLEDSLKIARQNNNQNAEQGALRVLATLYLNLREFEKAESYSEQSLAIQRKSGKYNEAHALSSNGLVYLISGKYDKAKENYELALKISREIDNKLSENNNLEGLALIYSNLGQYEQAIVYYQDSLKIAREKNHPRKIYSALQGLGSANSSLSRYDEANKYFEEALVIANGLQLKREIAAISSRLGNVYNKLSRYDKAKELLERALKIAEETEDKLEEGLALTYLGQVYSNLNQYDKAREYYEKVLRIGKESNNIFSQYDALTNLGFVYINFNQYDKAREYLDKAGALSKEIKSASSGINVLYGLGAIYTDLNNPEKAAALVQQSLEMIQKIKNRSGEGIILNKFGEIYLQSKQYDKAQEQYEKALTIAREVKNISGEADALISLGYVFLKKNELEKAKGNYEQGLKLAKEIKSKSGEGWAINGLGEVFFKYKKYKEAEDFYRQSLVIAREVQSKKLEGGVLQNLMELYKELRQPQIATIYGKQAVNIFQEIRGNIKSFEKESQQSYLKDKESAYRTLADLLISQDRFSEAQAILNLLKEEEFSQLARTGEKGEIIPYNDIEAGLLEKIENIIVLERRHFALRQIKNRTGEQEKEAGELLDKITAANKALDNALKELAKAENSVGVKIEDFGKNKNLKGALTSLRQRTNSGVVALYTLLGKEESSAGKKNPEDERTKFGWIILVTEKGQKAYPIDVADFNRTIFQFKDALSSDKYDPRPLAQKIYNALFRQKSAKQKRTLEQDLQEYLDSYQNKTLMWSLDGVLRYIPMSALHDGKNYLAEKYLNTIFTEDKFLLAENIPNWTILGLGVSEKREEFEALPGVKIELETIVREADARTGILSGAIKLNENFKKGLFFNIVSAGDYPVVHIASHYSFKPTQQKESFLLVGDGRLTFTEMEEKDENLFGAVDLLTLSACDTGVSGNGKEAESFGYKAQSLGAKSVIASLWKVSDAGTPELMIRFYKLRADNPKMSKGEAFRQAQLSLLGNYANDKTTGAGKNNRGVTIAGGNSGELNLPLFVKDGQNPFAHPHYWSSFVLIGNWR
jgi:CHAT domain-containing protein/uncharacterized protein HemY